MMTEERSMQVADTGAVAAPEVRAASAFWPQGWWRIMEFRIGIVPLPVYLLLLALFAGFIATGSIPSEISVAIALLAVGGFT